MREIKFRGKTEDNIPFISDKWWYGGIMVDDDCIWLCIEKEDNGVVSIKMDPETIGQFTGLKDVNGTEIYEGDIVESVFEPIKPTENHLIILGVVEWWNERAEFIVNCNNLDGFNLSTIQNISGYKYADGRFKMTFATKGKVIGNIHDNPEKPP